MLALSFAEYGPPSVLRLVETPEPHAGAGEVRIAVRAASVNPFDWKVRAGLLKDAMPLQLPHVVGSDASGVVDEVGAGVVGVQVGDAVFGLGHGVTAERAVLHHFAKKPASLSWEEAAGISAVAEAAQRSLDLLQLSRGQTLLIDGAAGAVGAAAAQLAQADGLIVIGTASAAKHDVLRKLGVTPTTYGEGLQARVAQLAPNGVQGALDTAGKGSLPVLVAITGSASKVVTLADFKAHEHGVTLTTTPSAYHALGKVAALVEAGQYEVLLDEVLPWTEGPAAHERSASGKTLGKVVLQVQQR